MFVTWLRSHLTSHKHRVQSLDSIEEISDDDYKLLKSPIGYGARRGDVTTSHRTKLKW